MNQYEIDPSSFLVDGGEWTAREINSTPNFSLNWVERSFR